MSAAYGSARAVDGKPGEFVMRLTRAEDGGYRYTFDGDGVAAGGGRENAGRMLHTFEDLLVVIEDRANGGSGLA